MVPNSSGTQPPLHMPPTRSCDAHCHILDARFPTEAAATPPGMDVAGYRLLQHRIGTARAVIVQAKHYRTDNTCLLDAISQMAGEAVGVAVVHPGVSDAELTRLDAGGVRGLRFSLWNPADTVTTAAMIEPLAARIAPFGWHVQLHMSGDQLVENAALLARLPCPIVIDHMGRLPPDQGPAHPAFRVIANLLERGRTWVKLSGAYLNTQAGPPDYPDATRIAQAFVAVAPERMVWGSDWPHVTEHHKPDDANLLDLLMEWSGSESVRARVLVDNPAELYRFGA